MNEFLDDNGGSIFIVMAKFILENKIKEKPEFFSKLEDIDIISFVPRKYILFYLSALRCFKQYKETGEEAQKPFFQSLLDEFRKEKDYKDLIIDWNTFVSFLRNYISHISFETAHDLFQKILLNKDAEALLQSNLIKIQTSIDTDIYSVFPVPVPNIATKVSSGFITPEENMEEMAKELLEDIDVTSKKYISFGYEELDNLTVYKMEEGGISIISGRGGAGKTTLKCNLIYKQITNGIPIFSWTPEMGRRKERNTLLSIHTGLSVQDIFDYRSADDPEYAFKILKQGIEEFKKFPYYAQDQFIDSADHFIQSFEKLIEENRIKVAYLDNADNIRAISENNEAARKSYTIQETLRKFQDFSKKIDIHTCCMWQLNRDAVDKRTGKVREKNLDNALSFSDTVNQIADVHLSVQKDVSDTYSGIGDGVSKIRSAKARGGLHNQNTIVLLVRDKFGERLYGEKEIEMLGRGVGSEDIPLPEEEEVHTIPQIENKEADVDLSIKSDAPSILDVKKTVHIENPFVEQKKESFTIEYTGSDKFTAEDIYNFKIIPDREFENDFKKTKQLLNTDVYDLNRWRQIRAESINLNKEIYQTLIKRIKSGIDSPISLLDKLLPEKAFSLLCASGLSEFIPVILCSFDFIDKELIVCALPFLSKHKQYRRYLELAKTTYKKEVFERILQIAKAEGHEVSAFMERIESLNVDKKNIIFDEEEENIFGEIIV